MNKPAHGQQPFEMEQYLLPPDKWNETVKKAYDSLKDGSPMGCGYNEDVGWFIIGTAGQGPYWVWDEHHEYTLPIGE